MRIGKLELENFRCFSAASIDLSADIIAVYGRNGIGKTALFDAVEFALFGRVERLEGPRSAFESLRNVYANTEARVTLDLINDDRQESSHQSFSIGILNDLSPQRNI